MVCESTIQCLAPYRWGQDYHARKEKLQAENQELQVHTNCWATLCSVQVLSSTADSALCVSTPPQYIIIHKSTHIRTYLPSYIPNFQFLTSIHPFIHTCTYVYIVLHTYMYVYIPHTYMHIYIVLHKYMYVYIHAYLRCCIIPVQTLHISSGGVCVW